MDGFLIFNFDFCHYHVRSHPEKYFPFYNAYS